MGIEYGISEGQASKLVRDVEDVVIKSGVFSLPSKRELYKSRASIKYVMIDATESPIQRPKKKQKKYYSGKKKQHTQKAQVVIGDNLRIICINTTKGKDHDFSLFKKSGLPIAKEIQACVDLGYLGIKKFHKNSEIPKKASKNHPLTNEDKKENQKKSSRRIPHHTQVNGGTCL